MEMFGLPRGPCVVGVMYCPRKTVLTEIENLMWGDLVKLVHEDPQNVVIFNGDLEAVKLGITSPGAGTSRLRGKKGCFEMPTFSSEHGGVFRKLTPEIKAILDERFDDLRAWLLAHIREMKKCYGIEVKRVLIPTDETGLFSGRKGSHVGIDVRRYITDGIRQVSASIFCKEY